MIRKIVTSLMAFCLVIMLLGTVGMAEAVEKPYIYSVIEVNGDVYTKVFSAGNITDVYGVSIDYMYDGTKLELVNAQGQPLATGEDPFVANEEFIGGAENVINAVSGQNSEVLQFARVLKGDVSGKIHGEKVKVASVSFRLKEGVTKFPDTGLDSSDVHSDLGLKVPVVKFSDSAGMPIEYNGHSEQVAVALNAVNSVRSVEEMRIAVEKYKDWLGAVTSSELNQLSATGQINVLRALMDCGRFLDTKEFSDNYLRLYDEQKLLEVVVNISGTVVDKSGKLLDGEVDALLMIDHRSVEHRLTFINGVAAIGNLSVNGAPKENSRISIKLVDYPSFRSSAYTVDRKYTDGTTIENVAIELTPGDLNRDGIVGSLDLALFSYENNLVNLVMSSADLNKDGLVDIMDFYYIGRFVKTEIRSKLTGEIVSEETVQSRPMVVMLDNQYKARPQASLSDADVIYEFLAEGGITRYMAVIQSKKPESVGPIRSARPYFIDKALEYDPIYVHVGGSPEALADIKELEIDVIDGLSSGAEVMWRTSHKERPHNLYSSYDALKQAGIKKGFRKAELSVKGFEFNYEGYRPAGTVAEIIKIPYKAPTESDPVGYTSEFRYDNVTEKYKRYVNGEAYKDERTNVHLSASNVIIQEAAHELLDSEGRLGIALIGRGNGKLVSKGKIVPITWEKATRTSATVYYGEDGNEIELNVGVTWIQVIPPTLDIVIEGEGARSKLTGEVITMGTAARRPLVVTLDNQYEARPQASLSGADIVYEFLVEGNITRYLTVIQSESPRTIGPIRSARPYLIETALEYAPVYVHVGGSPQALEDIKTTEIDEIEGLTSSWEVMWRKNHKKMPHNLYSSYEALNRKAEELNYASVVAFEGFNFNYEGYVPVGEAVINVKIPYKAPTATDSVGYTSEFRYDSVKGQYMRYVNGVAYKDEATRAHLAADNVIIQKANHAVVDDEGRLSIELVGQGAGYFITRGNKIPLTWSKASKDGRTVFYDVNNEEISLNVGKTWIQVIPADMNIIME